MAEPWPMVIRVQMSIRLTMIPNRSSGMSQHLLNGHRHPCDSNGQNTRLTEPGGNSRDEQGNCHGRSKFQPDAPQEAQSEPVVPFIDTLATAPGKIGRRLQSPCLHSTVVIITSVTNARHCLCVTLAHYAQGGACSPTN